MTWGAAMAKMYRCCLLEADRTIVVQTIESGGDASALLKVCGIITASNVVTAELWDDVRMVAMLSGRTSAARLQPAGLQAAPSHPLPTSDRRQQRRAPARRHVLLRRTVSGMQRGSPAR